MDEFEKLLYEMEEEVPFLSETYHHFHAGDAPTDRLIFEYGRGGALRNKIDAMSVESKEKYKPIFEDMGLWDLIKKGGKNN